MQKTQIEIPLNPEKPTIFNTDNTIASSQPWQRNSIAAVCFNFVVVALFLMLLISPVVFQKDTYWAKYDKAETTTITGIEAVEKISFNLHEPMGILLVGPLGILVFVFSWYWFLGYIFLIRRARKSPLSYKEAIFLIIFFCLCIFGAFQAFGVGNPMPGDMGPGPNRIAGYLSGFYIYIFLMLYLIVGTIAYSQFVSTRLQTMIIIVASIVVLAGSVYFTFTQNPHFSKRYVNINDAYDAYRAQVDKEKVKLPAYDNELHSYFGENNTEKLHFRSCDQVGPRKVYFLERLADISSCVDGIFTFGYSDYRDENRRDTDAEVQQRQKLFKETFTTHGNKVFTLKENFFGKISDSSVIFQIHVSIGYHGKDSWYQCKYSPTETQCYLLPDSINERTRLYFNLPTNLE